MTTASVAEDLAERALAAEQEPDETVCARTIEDFRAAYEARDVDRMLALFADDAEMTVAPGTFRGTRAIRSLLEWDARLSPTASARDTGVGLVVRGRTAVWERAISLTYRGIPYEEETAAIVEFGEDGRITRLRSYYDKLALMHQLASRYPGVQGWLFRRLTGYLVAQGGKGLEAT